MMKNYAALLGEWLTEDPFYERIFQGIRHHRLKASLSSNGNGCLAGIPFAQRAAEILGLEAVWRKSSGMAVEKGEEIGQLVGMPQQIVKIENLVIGMISKPSGIATAAQKAQKAAGGKIRLVSGGWKKHPFLIKELIWEAVAAGGLAHRIVDEPFIYLDKNYVRIFGGISQALKAAASSSFPKVIQLRGEFSPIAEEALEAIASGAQVLMVDTGSRKDLDKVLEVLRKKKKPAQAKLAFAGGIQLKDIPLLAETGVDNLDIGAAILDAPWLDLTYDVIPE
jgi:nicotinate-nucleotide pyrophosphorylase (carboxylating)